MQYTYLLVDFFTILVPFIFSFHRRIQFHRHFPAFLKASVLTAIPFLLWDAYFTHIGVWGFNQQYTLGIYLGNLPLEEVLFFFCIPFSCLFTLHCTMLFLPLKWPVVNGAYLIYALVIVLLGLGIVCWSKAYTATACISAAGIVVLSTSKFMGRWLLQLIGIYPLLLIPFFIVNGILTGTGLENPVVFYNDAENLGIRMLTIPVEDTVYGFELLVLNGALFHWFTEKRSTVKS